MQVYYELSDVRGTSNSFLVTIPSQELSNNVQDILIYECMNTQVKDLYTNHINLMNYIYNLLPNVENETMHKVLNDYLINSERFVKNLKPIISEYIDEQEIFSGVREIKSKNWKKDLSYARSIQTMSGYILNFYSPIQNLSAKLGFGNLTQIIGHLHTYTLQLHDSITHVSLRFVKNKFTQ